MSETTDVIDSLTNCGPIGSPGPACSICPRCIAEQRGALIALLRERIESDDLVRAYEARGNKSPENVEAPEPNIIAMAGGEGEIDLSDGTAAHHSDWLACTSENRIVVLDYRGFVVSSTGEEPSA